MKKGFTLIELLVVIAIIGILAGLIILGFNSARQKSRDAKRRSDVSQLRTKIEEYLTENESAPPAPLTAAALGLAALPTDPSSGANYGYAVSGQTYTVGAILENASGTANGPKNCTTAPALAGYEYCHGN